jgi:murein DD-endopeptidase MepM/ murein hydrolase activator NlpD
MLRSRSAAAALMLALVWASAVPTPGSPTATAEPSELGWVWPAEAFRLVRPFESPAHEYGPGHRGLDLAPDPLSVRAPADGFVAFVGPVAGRGVITIDHGGGLVTTLEPVAPAVTVGQAVRRGERVGLVAAGGHAAAGALHFGVRRDGEYINPQLLLGGVPRAVLLPCC